MPKSTNPLKCYFDILGSQKQLLQLMLMPGQSFYAMWPQVIYGSEHLINQTRNQLLSRFFRINNSRSLTLIKAEARNNASEYIALRRNPGQILCLDLTLYGDMFVHFDYLLGINYVPRNSQAPEIHPASRELGLFVPEGVDQQQFVFVQALSNPYIQKELGEGEKLATYVDNLLAVSRSVSITKRGGTSILEGPGFVFLAPGNLPRNKQKNLFNQIILVCFALLLFEILFTAIINF